MGTPRTVDHRPDLRLAVVLGLVILAASAGPVAWALSVRDRLPDPVARHWGAGGVADGFSPLAGHLALQVGMVVLLTVPLALAAVVVRQPVGMRRCLAGGAGFLATFLGLLFTDALRGQLDLTDPALAPSPDLGLGLGTLVGVLTAGLAAAAAHDRPGVTRATSAPPQDAPRRGDGTVAFEAMLPGLDTAAWVLAAVSGTVLLAMTWVLTWWLLPLTVLTVGVLLAFGRVRCRIDSAGLEARALGVRVLRVPIEDIGEADVVDLDPFWEFGGWGLRLDTAGRVGLVTRKGPAVRIRRGDDSQVLVSLDDAQTAAATLNSLADLGHRR